MNAFGVIVLIFSATLVVVSNQQVPKSADGECPLQDNPSTINGKVVHNITRATSCVNGRRMAGCCVARGSCNFTTAHVDLTLYGPPGFRMFCHDVCCPLKYILPISLPSNSTGSNSDDDNDLDSDSDESD
ncbi:unnamed protein product [Spodoptera exigua]|nr:unnamed protein product [Spodoptera exigua]